MLILQFQVSYNFVVTFKLQNRMNVFLCRDPEPLATEQEWLGCSSGSNRRGVARLLRWWQWTALASLSLVDCGPSAPLPIEATERLWALSVVSKGMLLFSRKTTWMEPVYSFHVLLIFVTKMFCCSCSQIFRYLHFFFASTKWNLYLASILKLGSDLMKAEAPVSTNRLLCNWVIIFSMFKLR